MAKPISLEVRMLIINAVFVLGYSRRAAAVLFNVSVKSAVRFCKRWEECGTVEPLPMGGDRRSKFKKRDRRKICRWLVKKPDTTGDEIRVRLAAQGFVVSTTTIRRVIADEGLSWKKKTGHACERERPDVQERRRLLEESLKSREGGRVICFDETAVTTNMMRPCGWSPRGERCPGSFPFSHRNTTTLIAALSLEGIVAPMILDGPLNGDAFRAWVEQVFVPLLRNNDTVVCDNLAVHKIKGISELIEKAGAKLVFLPPYSPDLNPIEKAFSQIKAHLKKVAARTKRKLIGAIASAIDLVKPRNAVNYYTSCGYQSGTI